MAQQNGKHIIGATIRKGGQIYSSTATSLSYNLSLLDKDKEKKLVNFSPNVHVGQERVFSYNFLIKLSTDMEVLKW